MQLVEAVDEATSSGAAQADDGSSDDDDDDDGSGTCRRRSPGSRSYRRHLTSAYVLAGLPAGFASLPSVSAAMQDACVAVAQHLASLAPSAVDVQVTIA